MVFLDGSISSSSYLISFTFCRKNGGPSWSSLEEAVLSFFYFSPSWMYICNLYESIYESCSIILLAQECPTHSPALISDAGGPYDFGNIWGYLDVLMLVVCMQSRNLWTCDCRIVVDFKSRFHLQPPWVFVSHGLWSTEVQFTHLPWFPLLVGFMIVDASHEFISLCYNVSTWFEWDSIKKNSTCST